MMKSCVVCNTYNTLYTGSSNNPITGSSNSTYMQWHISLRHSSNVRQAAYVEGNQIPPKPTNFTCHACIMSNSTNSVPKGLLPGNKTTRPFEVIAIPSYYITFIDDLTRMTWMFLLKNKSDASRVIQEFIAHVERQFKTTVSCMITDNGGEYVEAEKFLRSKGIRHLYTPPVSHQSNGVPERYKRILQTMVRSMLIDHPDPRLWAEACTFFFFFFF